MQYPQQQHLAELAALQSRALDLQTAMKTLEAQREVLIAQVEDKTLGTYRDGAQSKLLQLQVDLAGTEAQLQAVNHQIAMLGGSPPQPQTYVEVDPHPPSFLDRIDNDALTAMTFTVLLSVLVPLSIGLSRRLWRRPAVATTPPPGHDEVIARLGRVEQAVDTIAIEIERVAEGQRFVTKVMSERPIHARASAQVSDANDPALGDAQPFLALGAGPMEPIRVAERQKVKPSITPH